MALAKIIILEGADGSGKTTLANWLHDVHGYQVVKTNAPKPGEDIFKTYTDPLMAAAASVAPTVFDRHYLGETIYGPLLRGQDGLGAHGAALLERLVAALGAALVICAPPWETLVAGWGSKEDMLKHTDQLRAVNDRYLIEAKRLGLAVYDWTKGIPLTTEVSASLPIGVTGYHDAEVLWVGERTNTSKLDWNLPFHDLGGSSKYLWDALQATGWGDRRGAWVNALDLNGRPRDLSAIVRKLQSVRCIVALGAVAHGVCEKQRLNSVQVPHPAYWKRFHAHDEPTYQNMMRKAIKL